MEQFEMVLKHVEGYKYVTVKSENGDLTIRLVPTTNEVNDITKHFVKITMEDIEKVRQWLKIAVSKTRSEQLFLADVSKACQTIEYEYWIATIEPSVNYEKGYIYYNEGEEVAIGIGKEDWSRMAKEFAPARLSRLANLYELFLWYALRIIDGHWTLDYIANNSHTAGNYWRNADSAKGLECSGAREVGGYKDGQGNSRKIVDLPDDFGWVIVGGEFGFGWEIDKVTTYYHVMAQQAISYNATGVLVLLK